MNKGKFPWWIVGSVATLALVALISFAWFPPLIWIAALILLMALLVQRVGPGMASRWRIWQRRRHSLQARGSET